MHAPAVAAELRLLGHDVVAVKERSELVGLPDAELFITAISDGRAIVTENVKDFAALYKPNIAAGPAADSLLRCEDRPRRESGNAGLRHAVPVTSPQRFVVKALPTDGVSPSELSLPMAPHPLMYQEQAHDPDRLIPRGRLIDIPNRQ